MLPPTLSADEVRTHLEHVLSSASFSGSGRASALLAFLVEEALRGEGERLKEYTLGVEALGKGESFDPRIDPIVRTEMSRLRVRLDRYYTSDGRAEGIAITLPKGSYVPRFDVRKFEPRSDEPVRTAEPSHVAAAFVWFAIGAVATGAAWLSWSLTRSAEHAVQRDEIRVDIVAPPTTEPTSLAISPDGRKLVYSANVDGRFRLWVRSLDSVAARPLDGTDGARYPFWSPDGKSIGYYVADLLNRMDVETGAEQTLFNRAAYGLGGAWSSEQVVLMNGAPAGSLMRIPAMGGVPTKAVALPSGINAESRPHFLPDGRHVLYLGAGADPGIYIGELGGTLGQKLIDADTAAYLAPGYLLFVRQGTLFAQPFDSVRLALSGTPKVIANQILFSPMSRSSAFAASAAGSFVYRASPFTARRQFVWFDRSGRELGAVPGSEISGRSLSASLSPNGRQLAFDESRTTPMDIWLLDVVRGVRTRFTSDPAEDMQPVWSPDGKQIVFHSNRNGGEFDLWLKSTVGAGEDQLLLRSRGVAVPFDWSRDGRFILYGLGAPQRDMNIWALPMFGDRKPFPVVQSSYAESDAQFSPDGRWIAFMSAVTEPREIYIQRFSRPGRRWRVSSGGGTQPRWRGDGKELFFLARDNRLMAAPIRLSPEDDVADIDTPKPLFTARLTGFNQGPTIWSYISSPDGQSFLMDSPAETASPITLVLNWKPRP